MGVLRGRSSGSGSSSSSNDESSAGEQWWHCRWCGEACKRERVGLVYLFTAREKWLHASGQKLCRDDGAAADPGAPGERRLVCRPSTDPPAGFVPYGGGQQSHGAALADLETALTTLRTAVDARLPDDCLCQLADDAVTAVARAVVAGATADEVRDAAEEAGVASWMRDPEVQRMRNRWLRRSRRST